MIFLREKEDSSKALVRRQRNRERMTSVREQEDETQADEKRQQSRESMEICA